MKDTITIEEFENWEIVGKYICPLQDKIKECFKDNKNKAITTKVIANYIYNNDNIIKRNRISKTLNTMKKKNIVEHKSPYWRLKSDVSLVEGVK